MRYFSLKKHCLAIYETKNIIFMITLVRPLVAIPSVGRLYCSKNCLKKIYKKQQQQLQDKQDRKLNK